MPTPFEEIELSERQYSVFELLLDGNSLAEIASALRITRVALTAALARMSAELRRALPEQTTTYYHLMAQEFMRRQDAILAAAVATDPQPKPAPGLEDLVFFVRGPQARSAEAGR